MTPRALLCRRRREAYGSASGPVRVPPPLPPDFLGVDAEAAAEARLAEAKGGQRLRIMLLLGGTGDDQGRLGVAAQRRL